MSKHMRELLALLTPIFRAHQRAGRGIRVLKARISGTRIGRGTLISRNAEVWLETVGYKAGAVTIGSYCRIEKGAVIEPHGGHVSIADRVFLGPYTVIYGHGGVLIGADTLIAMHCRILSSNHRIPKEDRPIYTAGDILLPTQVGRDVWLGAGVTVLGGVTIHDGCVVGAGSVVTQDLPPYSIAWGVPARVRGTRSQQDVPRTSERELAHD